MATPEAVAGYLVESHSGVVAPLASRTGVPDGASLEVDPERASEPVPGLVVVPFTGHGFPRPDFVGEAELHLRAAARWPRWCSAPRSERQGRPGAVLPSGQLRVDVTSQMARPTRTTIPAKAAKDRGGIGF